LLRRAVSAFITTAFLDEAKTDVLAYMTFPTQRRTKLYLTNPIEHLNGEIKHHNLQPQFNICPTTTIDTVVERDGVRELARMRWGLIPA
jgi:putative SOS response-associated peptidase YedK